MKFNILGNTGIKISRLGLGTWSLGGKTPGKTSYGNISKKKSLDIISKSFDLGINFFDTSPAYGFSEEILGNCFKNRRDKVILCSKVGMDRYKSKKNFSPKFIKFQVHKILKNLKSDYIDFIKMYNPDPNDKILVDGYGELLNLKKRGFIKHIGVSLQSPSDLIKFDKKIKFEIVQCNFNLLDLRVLEKNFLNKIKKDRIGLVARTIYCFGVFTEKFIKLNTLKKKLYSKNDHRNRWSKQQINKWIEGVREIKLSLQEKRNTENLATRFVNSYKFISTSLIGVQSEQELKNNINKDNFIPLSRNKLKKIKLINKKNFFLNRLSPNRIT